MSANDASAQKNSYVLHYFGLVLAVGGAAYVPYVLSTYGVVSSDLGAVCLLIGSLTPTIVAVALTWRLGGSAGLRELFSRFARRGFPKKWLLAAFVVPLVVCLVSLVTWLFLLPNAPFIFYRFNSASLVSLPLLFAVSFALNVWDEIGWRGFAQTRMQTNHNVLLSAFVVGFFWAVWQLPLFLTNGSALFVNYQNPLLFMAFAMLLSVVYAWVYNASRGSLLVASLFHASVIAFTGLLFFDLTVAYTVFPYYFGVVLVLALGLTWRFRSSFWEPKTL